MGSAWLSGFNLYATVVTLGLLQRFHLVELPGELDFVSQGWVIGVASVLFVVEFLADKIPIVDSIWDAIHTFIRVPAGAVLAASAFAHFNPAVRAAALLAGGTLALGSHGTKASVRMAANASPEPFSNIVLSTIEDVFTVGLSVLAALHPLVMLGIVLVFVVFLIWMGRRVFRAAGRMLAQLRLSSPASARNNQRVEEAPKHFASLCSGSASTHRLTINLEIVRKKELISMSETQQATPSNLTGSGSIDQADPACIAKLQSEIDLAMLHIRLAEEEIRGGSARHARELIARAIRAHKMVSVSVATFSLQLEKKRELQGEARRLFESICAAEYQARLL